jgi:transposase-like protein
MANGQVMSLPRLFEKFGDEEKCRTFLEQLRWPESPECPKCGGTSISRIETRKLFECNEPSCRHQFSVTAGTVFHDSHLPLSKWFMAVYLIGESKKGISARQLQRTLDVSYKTAWYLSHRIRDAMGDDDQPLLRGIVEADESWHGGKQRGTGRGPYLSGKTMIMGVVQRDGEVRLKVGPRRDRKTLQRFIDEHVADEAGAIYTDEYPAYIGIGDHNTIHATVNHFAKEYVRGDVHTNTIEGVWSLFKRSVIGSFHQVSVKHLPRYLDELEFRFNNRGNPYLFRDTLLRLVEGDPLPLKELVHG